MTDHNKATPHEELLARLDKQAQEIASAGLPGWGNTMQDAAADIRDLQAKLEAAEEAVIAADERADHIEDTMNARCAEASRRATAAESALAKELRDKQHFLDDADRILDPNKTRPSRINSFVEVKSAIHQVQSALARCFEETRERCAVRMWYFFMDYCKQMKIQPGNNNQLFRGVQEIRALTQEPAAGQDGQAPALTPAVTSAASQEAPTVGPASAAAHDEAMRLEGMEQILHMAEYQADKEEKGYPNDPSSYIVLREFAEDIRAEIARRTSAQNKDHG